MSKPDLSQYPEIPQGCLINENKTFGLFQIYRNISIKDPITGKVKHTRETIGSIKNGIFTFSKTYLLAEQNRELSSKIDSMSAVNQVTLETNSQKSCERASVPASKDHDDKKPELSIEDRICQKLNEALNKTNFDERNPGRIEIPMLTIVLGSIMSALCGDTGCVEISEAINRRFKTFFQENNLSELVVDNCSHDTVRKALMLVEPESLNSLYAELISPLLKTCDRIIAADGQAIKATGKTSPEDENKHGIYMLMNFYDATNRVCLYHRLIQHKENEITVGPDSLRKLNLKGAVVTADAMSCQVEFVNAVISKGADYCLSLKGNQNKSFDEIRYIFNSTNSDQIIKYEPEVEKDHGRIEQYKVSIIRGSLLSPVIKEKWLGIEGGSLVKIERNSTKQTTNKDSWEERYYITSLPPENDAAKRISEVVRTHWKIENNLHWCLDVRFSQDRMQANNPNYIANRSALNKLALAYLENYRFWLWNKGYEKKVISINQLQKRCYDPKMALECVASSLGIV